MAMLSRIEEDVLGRYSGAHAVLPVLDWATFGLRVETFSKFVVSYASLMAADLSGVTSFLQLLGLLQHPVATVPTENNTAV